MEKKILDLFSGIGGFSLAAHKVGWDTAAFVEWDEWCQELLKRRFRGKPVYGDIDQFIIDLEDEEFRRAIGLIWCVTGGFPCQPMSTAGKRLGVDDPRYKWPATRRVHQIIQPPWVVYENVAGLGSMAIKDLSDVVASKTCTRYPERDYYEKVRVQQKSLLLHRICKDLEEDGFDVQVFNIPASGVGAPHQRQRLWIVAHSQENDDRWNKRVEEERQASKLRIRVESRVVEDPPGAGLEKRLQGSREDGEPTGAGEANKFGGPDTTSINSFGSTNEGIHGGRGGSKGLEVDENSLEERGRIKSTIGGESPDPDAGDTKGSDKWDERLSKGKCEESKEQRSQLVGEDRSPWQQWSWFEVASSLCRVDDGLPPGVDFLKFQRSAALKGLGNSVVWQIPYEIFRAIENSEPRGLITVH